MFVTVRKSVLGNEFEAALFVEAGERGNGMTEPVQTEVLKKYKEPGNFYDFKFEFKTYEEAKALADEWLEQHGDEYPDSNIRFVEYESIKHLFKATVSPLQIIQGQAV